MAASTACTLPTCRCAMPVRVRMNTSHSGHRFSVMGPSSLGRDRHRSLRPAGAFFRMRERRFAHPGAGLVSGTARLHALAVARAVTGDDPLELVPVDRPEIPVAGRLVERKLRV